MRTAHPRSGSTVLAFPAGSTHREAMDTPLANEDHPLFARAFREHYPDLFSFVRRHVGSETEAADIAQEAYLRVLRYRGGQDLSGLRMLVFRIALNLIGDRARMARSHSLANHVPLEEELALAAETPSQDREVEAKQMMRRLLAALDKLPRKSQRALVLRRFHGLTTAQTAERMKISVNAVEVLVVRASMALKKKLEREGS